MRAIDAARSLLIITLFRTLSFNYSAGFAISIELSYYLSGILCQTMLIARYNLQIRRIKRKFLS